MEWERDVLRYWWVLRKTGDGLDFAVSPRKRRCPAQDACAYLCLPACGLPARASASDQPVPAQQQAPPVHPSHPLPGLPPFTIRM